MSEAVDDLRRATGVGLSEAVNTLVRRGLASRGGDGDERFRQVVSDMGVPRVPLDDIGAVLELLDGGPG